MVISERKKELLEPVAKFDIDPTKQVDCNGKTKQADCTWKKKQAD